MSPPHQQNLLEQVGDVGLLEVVEGVEALQPHLWALQLQLWARVPQLVQCRLDRLVQHVTAITIIYCTAPTSLPTFQRITNLGSSPTLSAITALR